MVGMITNISDRKDTNFLSYNNTLSVEIKFHWQIMASLPAGVYMVKATTAAGTAKAKFVKR